MKAFNIKNGMQFSCSLKGESWRQGSCINGLLEISSKEVTGRVVLALGTKKKITKRDPKAYTIIDAKEFELGNDNMSFEFSLTKDCSVAETYLLFGSGEDLFEYGNLLLSIEPSEIIEGYLNILNLFYKFKTKKIKSNKNGFIEASVTVPPSKEYANIVSLKILLKLVDDKLVVVYDVVINKVKFEFGITQVVKDKMIIEKDLTAKEYLIYGNSINQDLIKESIGEVIEQIKKKQLKI